ncbi:hypothetical protein QBC39DRAFT_355795 [Podospora conica]|nr:hypothetical protein QBC39DRAFT_355795 [Schizothecium conicum]
MVQSTSWRYPSARSIAAVMPSCGCKVEHHKYTCKCRETDFLLKYVEFCDRARTAKLDGELPKPCDGPSVAIKEISSLGECPGCRPQRELESEGAYISGRFDSFMFPPASGYLPQNRGRNDEVKLEYRAYTDNQEHGTIIHRKGITTVEPKKHEAHMFRPEWDHSRRNYEETDQLRQLDAHGVPHESGLLHVRESRTEERSQCYGTRVNVREAGDAQQHYGWKDQPKQYNDRKDTRQQDRAHMDIHGSEHTGFLTRLKHWFKRLFRAHRNRDFRKRLYLIFKLEGGGCNKHNCGKCQLVNAKYINVTSIELECQRRTKASISVILPIL